MADNGTGKLHAYDKRTNASVRLEENSSRPTPLAVVPDRKAGYRGVFFGALEACEACGAVLAPEHKDLTAIHAQVCPGGGGDAA